MRIKINTDYQATKTVCYEASQEGCLAIGRAIWLAAMTPAGKKAFAKDRRAYLIAAGVDPKQLPKGRKIQTHVDSTQQLNLIMGPFKTLKFFKGDVTAYEKYLEEIGFVTIMGCR